MFEFKDWLPLSAIMASAAKAYPESGVAHDLEQLRKAVREVTHYECPRLVAEAMFAIEDSSFERLMTAYAPALLGRE